MRNFLLRQHWAFWSKIIKLMYLIKSLCKYWDYKIINQEGSHVILETNTPSHHRICVPIHYPLLKRIMETGECLYASNIS